MEFLRSWLRSHRKFHYTRYCRYQNSRTNSSIQRICFWTWDIDIDFSDMTAPHTCWQKSRWEAKSDKTSISWTEQKTTAVLLSTRLRRSSLRIQFPPQRPGVILRTYMQHPCKKPGENSPETIGGSNRWSLGLFFLGVRRTFSAVFLMDFELGC